MKKKLPVRPEHQAAARRLLAKLLTYDRRTFGYEQAYEDILLNIAAGRFRYPNPGYMRFYRYRYVTQDLVLWFVRYLVNGPGPYEDDTAAYEYGKAYLRRTDTESQAEHRVLSLVVWHYVLYLEPNADVLYHGS